jgi:2,5-diketo-D-gluconate reductase B
LTNKYNIPAIGFGTFDRRGEAGTAAIAYALELGYRHLDTAQSYETERECGEALRRSSLKRSEVFLTTKVTGANSATGRLIPSLEISAENLGVDQIDLTLIHWPVTPGGRLDMRAYLSELAEAQSRGLTRLIGVSNFTIADLEEAKTILGPGRLANHQFERHPFLQNQKLVNYCQYNGISVTCYLPLARGRCSGDPVVEEIAARHGATPHQIALAYSLNQGLIVIPTSGKHERIKENFEARTIVLSADELAALAGRDKAERQINPVWSPAWDQQPALG